MKLSVSLQLAIAASTAASAIHLNPQLSGDEARQAQHHAQDDTELTSLIESLRSRMPTADSVASIYEDSVDFMSSVLESAAHTAEDVQDQIYDGLSSAADAVRDAADDIEVAGKREFPDLTIYQLINLSEHTTKFAKIIDDYPDVVKLLNSTKTNHTLFVPIDEAFEHIPEHGEKPSKEFVEALLKYHIGLGDYPVHRILRTHTLPTTLDEKFLGGEPQRLRTSVGFTGVRINFYSKVVAADIKAKNGVIHAVRSILVPPTFLGRILSLFPDRFSTLLLAYEKTEFVKFIHHVPLIGATIFAPTNDAFSWLGPKVNAFLFNTETGLKYLDALLKYQITANTTLYSDAFYDETGKSEDSDAETLGTEHFDLTTLLKDAHVGVDIASWGGFRTIRVNGFAHVTIQDGIGKNGVIQVVDKVLIPPRKHKEADGFEFDLDGYEITVDELVSRFDPYLEESTDELEPDWEL